VTHSQTRRNDEATRAQLEYYYDTVPRANARVEDFGPLRLFVRSSAGWPYYARPALNNDQPITLDDVRAVLERQRHLGLPLSFEWVDETTPDLTAIAVAAGLTLSRHPLMIFDPSKPIEDRPIEDGPISDRLSSARILAPDDEALATAIAAAHVAFAEPGTAVGAAHIADLHDRAAELRVDGWLAGLVERMRAGRAVVAAAFDGDSIAVCSGQHNPIGQTTEIVAVGTLPSVRRQGYAAAVTSELVADAQTRGIDTIFLSAGDEDVARIYARIGFRLIGTALIAEAPANR
jgi:ribosomal protein S18 acetylase RimI-like enzyme